MPVPVWHNNTVFMTINNNKNDINTPTAATTFGLLGFNWVYEDWPSDMPVNLLRVGLFVSGWGRGRYEKRRYDKFR